MSIHDLNEMIILTSRKCGAGACPFEQKQLAFTSVGTHLHVDRDCLCLFEYICKLNGIQYTMDSLSCVVSALREALPAACPPTIACPKVWISHFSVLVPDAAV